MNPSGLSPRCSSGKRELTETELLKLMRVLGKSMDYFTDGLLRINEGATTLRA